MAQQLSPFYAFLEPTAEFVLRFPYSEDLDTANMEFTGKVTDDKYATEDESVALVSLGGCRYRLAEKLDGPFSVLPLNWGDEFIAESIGERLLKLVESASPQKYAHFRSLTAMQFSSRELASDLIHRFDGGWEVVAGGMLTISVPVEKVQEFRAAMEQSGLWPLGVSQA
jgi:hypothetical protein